MVTTSSRAASQLREQLIHKCFEAGIGFRMLVEVSKSGRANFSIKVDKQHQEDKVIESKGVRVFLDPVSAAQMSDFQLDYQDGPDGGFYLKTMQEARSG
jgi:Fe-S cluster assembly iron-binding protein IscA